MDQNKIIKIKEAILRSNDVLEELAELYKVFGDSTRTKILCCLEVKDLYVGELAEILKSGDYIFEIGGDALVLP